MTGSRNMDNAVSEIFKDGHMDTRTDGRTDKGDY